MTVLLEQTDPVVGVDRHHRRSPGMAHDLERGTPAPRELHRLEPELDHPSTVDELAAHPQARATAP